MLRARLVHQYNGAGQATLDRSSAELVAVKRDANQALCIPARTPACFRCSIVHLRITAICLTQAPTRRVLTPHATRRQWRSGWSHRERVTKQQPRKCRAPNHGAGHRGRPISEAEQRRRHVHAWHASALGYHGRRAGCLITPPRAPTRQLQPTTPSLPLHISTTSASSPLLTRTWPTPTKKLPRWRPPSSGRTSSTRSPLRLLLVLPLASSELASASLLALPPNPNLNLPQHSRTTW